jgi:hypothetical protein
MLGKCGVSERHLAFRLSVEMALPIAMTKQATAPSA